MEWTGARYADTPTVEVEISIDAPPDRVWTLVSSIDLMPTLSRELQSVEWLDDPPVPSVGARFRGYSEHPDLGTWSTVSYVVEHDPPRVFAWAVENRDQPAAIWRFTLRPHGAGTVLSQWMQLGPGPSGLSIAIEQAPDKEQKIVFVRLREFEESMTRSLAAIKTTAERA